MRRVAILGPMPASGTVGGVAVHTDRLAEHLALDGREVTVLSDSHVETWHADAVAAEASSPTIIGVRGATAERLLALAARHPGVALGVAARALGASARRSLGVPRTTAVSRSMLVSVAARESRAEVLHVQQADFRPLFADWAGVRLPRIITVHGLGGLTTGEYPALRRIVPANLASADIVVTPSRALADEVGALGVPPERVRVVPNGVDHDVFFPRERAACREALGLDLHAPLAVYVGRVTAHKGAGDLLAAWRSVRDTMPEAALALAGPVTADVDPAVPGVRTLGAVPHEETSVWMGAADVIVVPSRYEGFGLSALEAMASGRAVVATRVGGLAEIVPPSAGVLVPPADPDALADALLGTLRDRTAADAAGANGARAAAPYTWRAAAVAYGSLYDAL